MQTTDSTLQLKPKRLSPYSRAIDHQETLSKLSQDPNTPARTVLESIRLWFDLEGLKRDLRLHPTRRNKVARDAELLGASPPKASAIPPKPVQTTPAPCYEPDESPDGANPKPTQ